MSTSAIIKNIQSLPVAEQYFIIEQILKNMRSNDLQAEFAESGTNFDANNIAERNAVEQGYADYLNSNLKPHSLIKKRYERYL
jgi:hypothetical protein